jgi:WD40 repeat protein
LKILFDRKILEDGLLDTFEQHDDSVYGVCWSMADPWVFASISYDGRVVLNSISEELKMKILQI